MTHTKNRPHLCDLCGDTFISRADVVYHKTDKHKIGTKTRTNKDKLKATNIICGLCDNKFDTNISLEDHTNRVHLKTPLYCECGRKFYTKYYRDYHIRTTHNIIKTEGCAKIGAKKKVKVHNIIIYCIFFVYI